LNLATLKINAKLVVDMLNTKLATVGDCELWLLKDDLPCSAWLDDGKVCLKPATVARVIHRRDGTVIVYPRCDAHLNDNELTTIKRNLNRVKGMLNLNRIKGAQP
jgi:hypothetical protein